MKRKHSAQFEKPQTKFNVGNKSNFKRKKPRIERPLREILKMLEILWRMYNFETTFKFSEIHNFKLETRLKIFQFNFSKYKLDEEYFYYLLKSDKLVEALKHLQ